MLFFCVLIIWAVSVHAFLCLPLLLYGLAGFVFPVALTIVPVTPCVLYCTFMWLATVLWNIDTNTVWRQRYHFC